MEKSPLSQKVLSASVVGGSIVVTGAGTGRPLFIAYALGVWVFLRVGDPILGALGDGVAHKVRRWLAEQPAKTDVTAPPT